MCIESEMSELLYPISEGCFYFSQIFVTRIVIFITIKTMVKNGFTYQFLASNNVPCKRKRLWVFIVNNFCVAYFMALRRKDSGFLLL